MPDDLQNRVAEALQAFLDAQTWIESKCIVETHRDELLTAVADQILVTTLEQYKDDTNATRILEDRRMLLARCRYEGIDAAFADRLHASELLNLLEELPRLTHPSDIPRKVEVCQTALTLIDRSAWPKQWALLQHKLADSLLQNPFGKRVKNLEQAIHHYQQAVEVYTHQTFPEEWATIQNNLAAAYINIERIQGKRPKNLERAIHHYRQALEIYTSQDFPENWAMTQHNLGVAYTERIRGERADNLEKAIHHFEQALEVRTRQAFPEDWAMTQRDLATAYTDRIRGERAQNLEKAIHHYEQALKLFMRQAFPEQWATIQHGLATAYTERIRGERADNLEKAIHHFEQALEVRTYQAFPEDWAMTQTNLGVAHRNRIRGERADNLEKAIHHFEQALEVFMRQAFPEQWATIQHNLAAVYAQRIRGERAENLENAIHHACQAIEVRTYQVFPVQWAAAQHNLAAVYCKRIRGKRAENLEQAIFHYQQTLKVYTHQAFPEQWAMTQSNLGIAYADRIRGERAENLEKAIFHFGQALGTYTRQAFPRGWATAQLHLAGTYVKRIRGKRAENLEQAIDHYQQALEMYTRHAFPFEWAGIQNNLSVTYRDRIYGERAENLEKAMHHCHQALDVYTRQTFPEQWAMLQGSLAGAYVKRIRGKRADNLEKAIHHCHQALDVYTHQAFPFEWAGIQNALGFSYAGRIQGDQAENIKQAIYHYQQALEVYTRQAYPFEHRLTLRNVGNLHFDELSWKEALAAYDEAIKAGDALLAAAYTEAGRRAEVAETSRLYARAAYALLQLNQPAEALLKLEQGKTRLLAEALALADADLAVLPEAQQRDMLKARRSVRELEAEMRLPPDTPSRRDDRELATLLNQVRANLDRVIDAIRKDHPDFVPAGLDLPGILTLVSEGGALVAPLVTSQGSAVFVIPHGTKIIGAEHVIPLDGFTGSTLLELLQGPTDDHELGGWMGAYLAFRDSRTDAVFKKWRAAIETVTGHLWDVLMGPVHERLVELGLGEDAPVILMPQGGLGLLPLHAAWRQVDGEKRAFLDDYTVSYALSAYALDVSRRRLQEERRHQPSLLAVINPTGDLRHASIEGEDVAALFPADAQQKLVESDATQEAVVTGAPGRTYLHFSCHGFYHWRDAMQSGLLLAGPTRSRPDPLTLAEIISSLDLSVARLVTLSACETGITEFRQSPDEYIGLPAGFLQAGAPCVVSTLWAVDDLSTALLMACFYHKHLKESLPPSQALRVAQGWLRREVDRPYVIRYIESLLADLESQRAQVSLWSEEEAVIDRQVAQLNELRRYFRQQEKRNPGGRPFDQPFYWAAFTVSGADGKERGQTKDQKLNVSFQNPVSP